MMSKTAALYLLGVVGLALLIAACGETEPTSAPASIKATPIPVLQAQITTPAGSVEGRSPTPTPVSPLDRKVVLDFASGHLTITQDWEDFHADFDEWREGLAVCDASSVMEHLRGFAGHFVGISESARALPRDLIIRGLAGKVIAAAEREEEALRLLRDNWQPGDSSVFETVDVERSAASALRKEVEDGVIDLQTQTAPVSRELVDSFSLAFQQLGTAWDEFDRDYDAFRSNQPDLTSFEVVGRLSELVDEFRDLVVAVRELPASEVTRRVTQILAQAVEAEDLVLRKLRGTFEKTEVSADKELGRRRGPDEDSFVELDSEADQGQSEVEVLSASPNETSTFEFVPRDPTLFDAFDAQLVRSNALRWQALHVLADISPDSSAENQAAVAQFRSDYELLIQEWNEFHSDYDHWRQTEGGCDRSEAITTLGEFALRFGKLAAKVRQLPRATFLRPLGELFVKAAELEEKAHRTLRNSWRPFDSAVYKNLEQERSAAKRLRRQVAAGLQDLLAQYDVSIKEASESR